MRWRRCSDARESGQAAAITDGSWSLRRADYETALGLITSGRVDTASMAAAAQGAVKVAVLPGSAAPSTVGAESAVRSVPGREVTYLITDGTAGRRISAIVLHSPE